MVHSTVHFWVPPAPVWIVGPTEYHPSNTMCCHSPAVDGWRLSVVTSNIIHPPPGHHQKSRAHTIPYTNSTTTNRRRRRRRQQIHPTNKQRHAGKNGVLSYSRMTTDSSSARCDRYGEWESTVLFGGDVVVVVHVCYVVARAHHTHYDTFLSHGTTSNVS